MKVFKLYFLIFTIFSVSILQVNPQLTYAVEEERDGHYHGGHEEALSDEEHDGHDHAKGIEKEYEKETDSHKEHDDHRKKSDSHEGHDDHDEESDSHEGHDDHGEEGGIHLDEEARSMIQLKTEKVSKRSLGGHLKVYGKVAKDTENYSYITFDGKGTVKSIDVQLGAIVNKGDALISILKEDGTYEQIKSELHGAVLSIFVKTEDKVDSLSSLLSIIDVDTLRATIDIYERDLRLVKVGQKVVLTTAAYPNKKFNGKVVYISPQVDEHTQAIKVRVDVDNPEHLLRLGMFVSGELIYASGRKVVALPLSAVQQLNEEDIVFVEEEGSNLKVRDVVLGRSVGDYVEILKGLSQGETVVTQGSFYLKSEQAKEAFGDGHNH